MHFMTWNVITISKKGQQLNQDAIFKNSQGIDLQVDYVRLII